MAMADAPLPPGSYDSSVPTTIGVTIFCLSVASAAVVLRTYTRAFIINKMGVDDYFAVASLLLAYGSGISMLCMTQYGLGRHVWMLDEPEIEVPLYLRSFYVSIVMYCAGLFTIKMTFLFQYYRVFAVQNLRRVFITVIVIVGVWGISQVFIGTFICNPISGFWDPTVEATCIPNYPQFYINAGGNIITDIAVLVMPFPLLKRLRLPKQQKLLLFGIFGLGFFTVAISVLRIKYLTLFEDFTWENVETSAWSIGELCSGITCACLPTLRPFLKAHFPGLGTRFTNGYHDYQNDDEETAAATAHKRAASGDSTYPPVSEPRARGHMRPAESRESTEDIIGLETAGHEISPSREAEGERSSREDREGNLGLRMTVLSRMDGGNRTGPPRLAPSVPSGNGIHAEQPREA